MDPLLSDRFIDTGRGREREALPDPRAAFMPALVAMQVVALLVFAAHARRLGALSRHRRIVACALAASAARARNDGFPLGWGRALMV